MRWVPVGVVLSQRRTQLTGIEPAMGCDSGPPLNRNWVGRPTSCVSVYRRDTRSTIHWQVSNDLNLHILNVEHVHDEQFIKISKDFNFTKKINNFHQPKDLIFTHLQVEMIN